MDRNYIAVVNIGTSVISVVIGQLSAQGGLDIAGFKSVASQGVKRGVIINNNEVVKALEEAIALATKDLNIKACKVLVGISGQQIRTIPYHGHCWIDQQEVTQRDINKLLEEAQNITLKPGEKIFHLVPQSYTVDQEEGIVNPLGMEGTKLEGRFRILAAQESYFKTIERCFERLNIKVRGAVITPMATAEAVLSDKEKENGVVLIDFGAGTTQMAVFHKGIICHAAVIPFGGNAITQDIKEGCSLNANLAERLKRQHGYAFAEKITKNKVFAIRNNPGEEPLEISYKKLTNIIQARLEEILGSVWFQVRKSGYGKQLGSGIVITGGGSRLKGTDELIKALTGLDVRIGVPGIPVQGKFAKNVKIPEYSGVIGLLTAAIIRFGNKENFVEPIKVEPIPQPDEPKEEIITNRRKKGGFKKFSDFVGELFNDDDMNMN